MAHNGSVVVAGMVRNDDDCVVRRQSFGRGLHGGHAEVVFPHPGETGEVGIMVINLSSLVFQQLDDSQTR